MHHGVHVKRCLHLLLGIHGHVGEIGRHEGLRLVTLRIVENRGVHALCVKPKRLLDLLNNGLTLTMGESLPSREFLHLNKENVSKRNYDKINSQRDMDFGRERRVCAAHYQEIRWYIYGVVGGKGGLTTHIVIAYG